VSATLCFGQAIVELVGDGESFTPRMGGAAATVAVTAARAGAEIALVAAAGEDSWGRWLRDGLAREGVEVSRFELLDGAQTPVAFVGASYELYGQPLVPSNDGLGDALRESAGLAICADALIGEGERAVTMRARSVALELDRPVVLDASLRPHLWRSHADAAASVNACVPGALLVRAGQAEAELMTGESDPERAALALVKAGARLVLLTLGPDGMLLRGELRADVDDVDDVDDVEPGAARGTGIPGSGAVVTGGLLGRLALSDFYPPVVPATLGRLRG